MSYYLAPSLRALGDEVTAAWPSAPKWPTVSIGDGWVGDTSHQARKSDHNPDYSAGGVVRAVDIGIQGRGAQRILDAVIGDDRVWYVIHRGAIYSRTYGWAKRTYTGSNPHDHHIHVSIRHSKEAESSSPPWGVQWVGAKVEATKARFLGISLSNTRREFINARDGKPVRKLAGVKRIQKRLNHVTKAGLKVDGWVGKQTLDAYGKFERTACGTGGPRIPDRRSLTQLVRGSVYRVVK